MRHREAGFTLLEMMVALVVFGFVMAGLAQSFKFGLTAWSATDRRIAGPERLAAMDSALRRMIEQAEPGSIAGGHGFLTVTTALPEGAGLSGGLADVALQRDADGTLFLRYAAHPPGLPLTRPPAPQVEQLATGVSALQVSYLVQATGQPPVWSDRLLGGGGALLVRIHLTFADGREWPDLVVAPMAGAAADASNPLGQ